MREIKFRAWDVQNKKMIGHKEACLVPLFTPKFRYRNGEALLMQFTGFQDSKGNDIYEDDICTVAGIGLGIVEICKYNGTQFKTFDGYDVAVIDCVAEDDDFEIVGNIHQNPELLEQNDE